MIESRREKFQRLASKRTTSVLDGLRVLGNLSNRANYDYSEDEIKKIFNAIDSQLRLIKAKFQKPKRKEFRL